MWISLDEYFTLEMVKRTYSGIVYVDSFDVHPPLYYIVLKFLLNIFLPFKHTIILDIIFSRLFSVVCSLVMVHFLIKINSYFGITIKKHVQYVLFFLVPNVLSVDNMNFSPSTNIRMYALATMFVVLTMYFCLKYNNSSKFVYQIFIILFADLAAYTHYYAAVVAGLFIFFYFVYYLMKKNLKKCLSYLLSGILFFVIYIPWIIFGMTNQFREFVFKAPLYKTLVEFIAALIIVFIFIFPFMLLFKRVQNDKKIDLIIVLLVNITILISTTAYSFIKSPIFLIRYVYPALIIFEFISVCYAYQMFINKENDHKKITKAIMYSIVFVMPFVSVVSLVHEVVVVLPISVNLYKNDKILANTNKKYVNIDNVKYHVKEFDFNGSKINDDTEYALYLQSVGKVGFVTDKKRYKYDLTTKAYPNIHFVPETVKYMKK